jgi:DNA repair protein RecO (recombination protein O)
MRPLRIYTAEGIILKRISTGEADRIITVFTKQFGKIRMVARGVRKITSRRAGHLEVFTHGVYTLHGGHTIDLVSEASTIRSGSLFDTDAPRLEYAYCTCELVDQLLADRQEHEDVFFLLRDNLNALLAADSIDQYQVLLVDFIHALLWTLGFLPRTRHIDMSAMQQYIERITERKLRAWPLSISARN